MEVAAGAWRIASRPQMSIFHIIHRKILAMTNYIPIRKSAYPVLLTIFVAVFII